LVTQFTVALNDNMFRWLIVPIGKEFIGQDYALGIGAICFLAPFLIFAGLAGFCTDRFSKRSVMIACKFAEILIMVLGIAVILIGNIWLMLGVLFLMGAQSAFFSPSKYGSLPEIVSPENLAKANGLIGMTTMIAIILGVAIGGYLFTMTTPPSILLVTQEPELRTALGAEIRQAGFRLKLAATAEEALDQIRRGAPRLAFWDLQLAHVSADLQEDFRTQAAGVKLVGIEYGSLSANPLTDGSGEENAASPPSPATATLTLPVQDYLEWSPSNKERFTESLRETIRRWAGSGVGSAEDASRLAGQYRWWISAAALIGVATVGWIASFFVQKLPAANPRARFPQNPLGQVILDLGVLGSHRPLLGAALASGYFWALGAMAQLAVDKLARPELVIEQHYVGYLLAILTLGIGLGSFLAGIWSGKRVELGLVPWGALGISAAAMMVATIPHGTGEAWSAPYLWACFWLLALGCTAGLYDIPLLAFLQEQSPREARGRVLAANNFIAFSGMLLMSAVFGFLTANLGLSARQVFLFMGLLTVPVAVTLIVIVPTAFLRVLARLLVWLRYRLRVEGLQNLPPEGGVLLVANHVTWIDWLILTFACPRPIHFLADPNFIPRGLFQYLAYQFGVISLSPGSPTVRGAIRAARAALKEGKVVCVFPEGGLSRTGQILGFYPGYQALVRGIGAPVVPTYLGGLWGSVFSFAGGKYFWKWPKGLRRELVVKFGQPLHEVVEPLVLRRKVELLGVETMLRDDLRSLIPARRMLRVCRKVGGRLKCADTLGATLSASMLLVRSLVLRQVLRRQGIKKDEFHVGVMLPSSVAGLVVNATLALDRRVSVNLNYTLSSELLNICIAKADIKHVITSRKLLERFPLKLNAELIFLEDIPRQVTNWDKAVGWFAARLMPVALLERWLGLTKVKPEDLLTIIFTSGSTGDPKGVMLTQRNIGSNLASFNDVLRIRPEDVMVGILPFFHSFGYTTTLWAALTLEPTVVYHTNPLEARQVGQLCQQYRGTILLSTPTFLRSYLRRCDPEQFASLDVIITGAEKLPPELATEFEQRFGVRPYEGYGTTELAPVVSTNIPPSRQVTTYQPGCREGSVGRTLPGIVAKVVDLDTGADLGANQVGMLLVKGPNVMKGYLHEPEKTAEVIRDGWYVTGDLAKIDEDGFIYITGRVNRFSKIGGEMVPHEYVEEAIRRILGWQDEEEPRLAVIALPDPRKGERLIVAYTELDQAPEEICRQLATQGMPPLWIPSPEAFRRVATIPRTGSGKIALGQLKRLVLEELQVSQGERAGDHPSDW